MLRTPAPVAVTVEIRALDLEDRVWRAAAAVGDEGMRFERDLPWEPKRPVSLAFRLPGDDVPFAVTGVIAAPDAVSFVKLDAESRRRLVRYVQERMLES